MSNDIYPTEASHIALFMPPEWNAYHVDMQVRRDLPG